LFHSYFLPAYPSIHPCIHPSTHPFRRVCNPTERLLNSSVRLSVRMKQFENG
jgi:hypothetical protein